MSMLETIAGIASGKHQTLSSVNNTHFPLRDITRALQSNPFLESFMFYVDYEDGGTGNVQETRLTSIVDAVLRNRNVTVIHFSWTIFGRWFPVQSLRHTESLKELCFTRTFSSSHECEIFRRILRVSRRVQTIKLYRCQSTGDSLALALALAQRLRYRSSLQTIHIIGCYVSEAGLTALGKALQQYSLVANFVYQEDNDDVAHAGTISDDCAQVWATAIERSQTLNRLELTVARFSAGGARCIVESLARNHSITVFELCGIESLAGEEGSLAVAHVIEETQTLERLALNGRGRTSDESVGLEFTAIARALVMNETLNIVNFGKCAVKATGLDSVCSAGRFNRTLEVLKITNSHIHSSRDLASLCRFLSQLFALKELDLSGVSMDNDAITALCESLEQMERLEILLMNSCELGDEEASIFSRFLAANKSLRGVSLGRQGAITSDGYASLGRALETNDTLKIFGVWGHRDPYPVDGMRVFLNGVKVNPTLESVYSTLHNRRDRKELEFYLDRNKRYRPLLKAQISLGLWPNILESASAHSLDMLNFVLQEKFEELLTYRVSERRPRKRKANRKWAH